MKNKSTGGSTALLVSSSLVAKVDISFKCKLIQYNECITISKVMCPLM